MMGGLTVLKEMRTGKGRSCFVFSVKIPCEFDEASLCSHYNKGFPQLPREVSNLLPLLLAELKAPDTGT